MNHQYRKKPVVIEAFQLSVASRWDNSEWPAWAHEAWNKGWTELGSLYAVGVGNPDTPEVTPAEDLRICTLEGPMNCPIGHWIIRGVQGELYACAPDIFEATYDAVQEIQA